MRLYHSLALLLLSVAGAAAFEGPANMSGTWKLNVAKSKWHGKPAPHTVEFTILHNEPSLKYTGHVSDFDEAETTFTFDGAIDGKEYPVKVEKAEQYMSFKRLSPYTVSSALRTADGKSSESATTTISMDGKALVRNITRKGPDGSKTWVEAYDKQ
jgi:hypothetical protein